MATVELEVARYALRTFNLAAGQLDSLYRSFRWENGVAEARCIFSENYGCQYDDIATNGLYVGHGPIPGERCECGLYGCLSVTDLLRQYGGYTFFCITVIAVEGPTIIGSKGLRTSAARVVAYWARDDVLSVFTTHCPEARRYADILEMARDYHIALCEHEENEGQCKRPECRSVLEFGLSPDQRRESIIALNRSNRKKLELRRAIVNSLGVESTIWNKPTKWRDILG